MARERISLVSDEEKKVLDLETRIRSGEINPDTFSQLTEEEQSQVNGLLFKMASSQIEPNTGTSALEFIIFGFMRVISKRVKGMGLTEDEKYIEQSLQRIMDMHQLSSEDVSKEDWLFDYMSYAEYNAASILQKRKEHIDRKIKVIGEA